MASNFKSVLELLVAKVLRDVVLYNWSSIHRNNASEFPPGLHMSVARFPNFL